MQATAEHCVGGDPRHPTGDGGEDEPWLHEDEREVDLVDATEEHDDGGAPRGCLGISGSEDHVGQQDAHSGTGVRLDQEQQ